MTYAVYEGVTRTHIRGRQSRRGERLQRGDSRRGKQTGEFGKERGGICEYGEHA